MKYNVGDIVKWNNTCYEVLSKKEGEINACSMYRIKKVGEIPDYDFKILQKYLPRGKLENLTIGFDVYDFMLDKQSEKISGGMNEI